MKLNSYILIFIGLLAVELIKNADASTGALPAANKEQRELCVVFGDAAYQMAVLRDDGADIFETRNRVYRNFDPRIQNAMLAIVDLVYDRPWHKPSDEANQLVSECLRRMGDSNQSGGKSW